MRSRATQAALLDYDAHQLARTLPQGAAMLCYARLVHTVDVYLDILYRIDEDTDCDNIIACGYMRVDQLCANCMPSLCFFHTRASRYGILAN